MDAQCGLHADTASLEAVSTLRGGLQAGGTRVAQEVAAVRAQDPLLWLRMGECCMSAAAAQLPAARPAAGRAAAGTDSGSGAAALLQQAAQCLANALAVCSACDDSLGSAVPGPGVSGQAPDGSGGRDAAALGAQQGSAPAPDGDEHAPRSERPAGQPGSALALDTGSTAAAGAAAAGSSAAEAASPAAADEAGSAAGVPQAGGDGLRTGAGAAATGGELPACAEDGRWQAGVVRLAVQAASAWVALERGDPRGALEHAQALLQVWPFAFHGTLGLCCMSRGLLHALERCVTNVVTTLQCSHECVWGCSPVHQER